jgi:hypothetical protein
LAAACCGTQDNGGNLGGSGNNLPLRGGKFTFWEGGVRSLGFVTGGAAALPSAVRGQSFDGIMHAADWWVRVCSACAVRVQCVCSGCAVLVQWVWRARF